jgi:DDE domain
VLEVFATKRRDRGAALKFLKRAMKRCGRPWAIVTDRLRSYGAAMRVAGNIGRQQCGRWLNNRAENSHQPFRRREGAMTRFRDIKTLQKFAAVHASVHNHFRGLCTSFRCDQHLVGDGFEGEADTEQGSEGGVAGSTAIEAEGELVEIGLEMGAAEAVVDAQSPGLEVGEHAVHPGQDDMRGHRPDEVRLMVDARDAGIAGPAVGLGGGARREADL